MRDKLAGATGRDLGGAVFEAATAVQCGPVSALISDGAIRAVRYHGVELVRAIDCPIRDANWGTAVPEQVAETIEEGAAVQFRRRFSVLGGDLAAALAVDLTPDGLTADLALTAQRTVQTNRAGFTLLHPLAGLTGAGLVIRHSDGSEEQTRFPQQISPGQPAFDIAGLRYTVHGLTAEITMTGEVFEMEDQRNWSDASYKTYCRPLGLPFPYDIVAGQTVTQRIEVRFSGQPSAEQPAAGRSAPARPQEHRRTRHSAKAGPSLPDIALAMEPGWLPAAGLSDDGLPGTGYTDTPHAGGTQPKGADPGKATKGNQDRGLLQAEHLHAGQAMLAELGPIRRLVRLDLGQTPDLALLDHGTGPFELELILPDSGALGPMLHGLAKRLQAAGLHPDSVIALPRAYLKSYQPTATWPDGHAPADLPPLLGRTFGQVFPMIQVGVGMLTNFTEFNRHPPAARKGDFATYSTTAIVHAGDDRSVFETLEALPDIHRSAQSLTADMPLRLGLASVGMRSNPYGAAVADNPNLDRIAMAMHDPRQRTVFAAAFAVGAYGAASAAGAARIALAGAGGPFASGEMGAGFGVGFRAWPLHHVLRRLCALHGDLCAGPDLPSGMVAVTASLDVGAETRTGGVMANCSLAPIALDLPGIEGQILDHATDAGAPGWLERAPSRAIGRVELAPAGLIFFTERT